MLKPCDICGDLGVIEAIITCCECKISREHLYCMRILRTEPPPFWSCEECEKNKLVSPKNTVKEHKPDSPIEKASNFSIRVTKSPNKKSIGRRFHFKEKRVDIGRTKYISCEEAVKLSSGCENSSKNAFCSVNKSPKPMLPKQASGPKEEKAENRDHRAPRERKLTEILSSPKEKAENRGDRTHERKLTEIPTSPKEKAQNRGDRAHERKLTEIQASHKEIKDEILSSIKSPNCEKSTQIEPHLQQHNFQQSTSPKVLPKIQEVDNQRHIVVVKSPENVATTEKNAGGKNHADVALSGSCDADVANLTSRLPVSETHSPYIPSMKAFWTGNLNLPEKLNDEFKGHPPARVHYKVYEAVKKMPQNIKFDLLPYLQIWMEMFPGNGPDTDDIGLYLFPISKNSCENIIEYLWKENLLMRSYVEGVELLVLSSKVLPTHSQEFKGDYFLWGVFRRPKNIKKEAVTQLLLEAKPEPGGPPGFDRKYGDVSSKPN